MADTPARQFRLAVVATPRSGNTWIRKQLAAALGLAELAVHLPSDVPRAHQLPSRVALQLHWRRTEDLMRLLDAEGFRVLTITRHPLDVLLSILQFCRWEPQTQNWLAGWGGSEASIVTATPASEEFRRYCVSARAAELLAVSHDWVRSGRAVVARYEHVVGDPEAQIEGLISKFGEVPLTSVAEVAAAHTLERLRPTSDNNHYWRGRPGHWRKLIGAELANEIFDVHRAVFEQLDYSVRDADVDLTPDEVETRWSSIVEATDRTGGRGRP